MGADDDGPAAAGKRSGSAQQGWLFDETLCGKITGAILTAAWEAISLLDDSVKSYDELMTFPVAWDLIEVCDH